MPLSLRLSTPLLRLMHYASLSRGVKLGPEDRIALDFATRLRVATLEGRLRAVWTHPANELAGYAGKATASAAIARALGLIPGTLDYLFLWGTGAAALECKSLTGELTDNQTDFRLWCAAQGVPTFVFRTADEGERILRDGLGVLD